MLKIVCVGRIKEKEMSSLIQEYLKRLSKYTKVEIVELDDYGYEQKENIAKEGEAILKQINSKDFVITLEINGQEMSSLDFAEYIRKTQITNSQITFVIGGSYGLDEKVQARSNFKMSFSKLTFPHQLFRLILLEQIYRAFKINNNETYHK